jgi:hypothetical protein
MLMLATHARYTVHPKEVEELKVVLLRPVGAFDPGHAPAISLAKIKSGRLQAP